MGLFQYLTAGAAHLILVAVDIFTVFILARLANLIWTLNWLGAMDRVGRPMTDWLLAVTNLASHRLWRRTPNERQRIAFALLVLLIILICVSAMFRS